MPGRLEGKVAVITGAGRGIGRAIALAYAAEGALVVCAARTEEQITAVVDEIGADRALAVVCDVTDHDSVKSLYRRAADAFGGVDIVVANAGGSVARERIDSGDPTQWVATIDLNLIGAYYTMLEAIPLLKERGAGKIIAVGSGAGRRGPAGNSAYAVSKSEHGFSAESRRSHPPQDRARTFKSIFP